MCTVCAAERNYEVHYPQGMCPRCGAHVDELSDVCLCTAAGQLLPPDGPASGDGGGPAAGGYDGYDHLPAVPQPYELQPHQLQPYQQLPQAPPGQLTGDTAALVGFLRARYAEQREAALEQRLQHWQQTVADLNAKQAVVDDCERWAILAAEAGRRITDLYSVGMGVDDADILDTARLEGRAAAVRNVVAILALPYARHPEYREEWRP